MAEEAAEAAKRLREKGVDLEAGDFEFPSETGGDRAEGMEKAHENDSTVVSGTDGSSGTEDAEVDGPEKESRAEDGGVDERVVTSEDTKDGGQGSSRERAPDYATEDDDIVARQLREAAEKETDPELKEKLWKEYEEYKGRGRK